MSDILLIDPYYTQKIKYYSFVYPAPPLGLMYLAAYLRKHGIGAAIEELGIFDPKDAITKEDNIRFGKSDEEIAAVVRRHKPKIVGITSMYTVYYYSVAEIARLIKEIDRDIKIVVGGNHPSSYYRYILQDKNIDVVVIGEGEVTFLELCRLILSGQDYEDIDGIACRNNGKITKTKVREPIKDLDEIPFPATDLLDFRRYFADEDDTPYLMRYPAATIITSRGCPNNCVYCTVKAVWGRSWRGRSAKNVVDEVEFLKDKYGVRELAVLDDSASVDKKRWNQICDEMIARKVNIKWNTPNGIAHWTLDETTIGKMHKAGCYRITFGIESGNVATRKFLGKPYSLKQAGELIQYANRIGMWTLCTNIIGFPYEGIDSIKDTLGFAKRSGTDFALFYLLLPQPTSDVYEYFRKENLLNLDGFLDSASPDWGKFEEVNYALNETGVDTKFFKKEELQLLQRRCYRSFIVYRILSYLFRPWLVLQKINSIEDLFYCTRIFKNGLLIFTRLLNPVSMGSGKLVYARK